MYRNFYFVFYVQEKENEFKSSGKDVRLEVLCYGLLALQGEYSLTMKIIYLIS